MTKEEFRDAINKIILTAKTVEEKGKKFDALYDAVKLDQFRRIEKFFNDSEGHSVNWHRYEIVDALRVLKEETN